MPQSFMNLEDTWGKRGGWRREQENLAQSSGLSITNKDVKMQWITEEQSLRQNRTLQM